jgi:hypothetical protein
MTIPEHGHIPSAARVVAGCAIHLYEVAPPKILDPRRRVGEVFPRLRSWNVRKRQRGVASMAIAGTQPDLTSARRAQIRCEPALRDQGAATLADLRVYRYLPLLVVVIILAPAVIAPPAVIPTAPAPTPIPAPAIRAQPPPP